MDINDFGRKSFVTGPKSLIERIQKAEKENQMRELKFRAWDTRRQKMWSAEEMGKDQLTLSPDGRGFVNVNGMSTKFSQWMSHLIPEQFTGLKDKNGKEIYSGDILHIWSTFYEKDMPVAEVFWNEKYAKFDIKVPDGCYHSWLVNSHRKGWFIEIIGTIHTHPELMEKENDPKNPR